MFLVVGASSALHRVAHSVVPFCLPRVFCYPALQSADDLGALLGETDRVNSSCCSLVRKQTVSTAWCQCVYVYVCVCVVCVCVCVCVRACVCVCVRVSWHRVT